MKKDELHWFWEFTTKWWFFPIFAFLLSFIFAAIFDYYSLFYYNFDISWILKYTFGIFFSIPAGLAYYFMAGIQLVTGWNMLFVGVFITLLTFSIFYVYFAVSIFKIVKSKNKENKILKKRIIILFLLILVSFIGFLLSDYYIINAKFAP